MRDMKRALLCFSLFSLASCTEHVSTPSDPDLDAGMDAMPDAAGGADATPADAGPVDSGIVDSGAPDAGPRTHGLVERVENTTCFLEGAPPVEIVPVGQADACAELSAPNAVRIVPDGDQLALVESEGLVRAFAPDGDGSDARTVLDLSGLVRLHGLRAAAFRQDNAALFVSYVPVDSPLRLEVARYGLDAKGVAQTATRQTLVTLPLLDETRSGGALAFLLDGTLVVALGDGGDSVSAADPSLLPGKLLRLDVSGASGYAVPADNPFAAAPTTAHEVYALGLLAPTSCGLDRVTGHLWCADAGDPKNDHLLLITPGATLRPILSYPRQGCGAVIGSVSRDARLPDIQGALVFGDGCSRTLQALRFDGSLVLSQADIATLPVDLAAFGEDPSGTMLAVDASGAVHALVRPATTPPAFPTTVSASGCIADMATHTPAASLIPFEVRAPLWSDGARKHRFISLPGKETIGFTETGAWQFPVGTIFMKEFALDDDNDAQTADPIMETRFLIHRTDSAWEGFSYMWDRDHRDAFLLEGAEIGSYAMKPGQVDSSGASIHRHTFPDRSQCLLCHNPASGRALGLQTGRMNTDHDYGGFVENQLSAMDYVNLFTDPLPKPPSELPRFAEPSDETAPLEDRARAWLYANCSHCHRPGGTSPVPLDFRYESALGDTHACGVTPRYKLSQLPNARIIDPGNSANSELFFRLSRRDQNQMPPIASLIVDPNGVDVMQRWIDSLGACP